MQITGELSAFAEACQEAFRNAGLLEQASRRISALTTNPGNPMAIHQLAGAAWISGRLDLWKWGTQLACCLTHETPLARFVRGCSKLRLDDWSGWQDYEARHDGPGSVTPVSAYAQQLRWIACTCSDLTDLGTKTLLMIAEGGFGDSIQSMCFVPGLVAAATRVILMVEPELVALFQHNFGQSAEIVSSEWPLLDGFDEYIWSSSVPTLFSGVPPFAKIRAPHPSPRFGVNSESLQIGICWAAGHADSNPVSCRTITDGRAMESLFSCTGIDWYSLQVDRQTTEIAPQPLVRPPSIALRSFTDTADVIAGLDCVVTVDTAVCHLAGRLGAPTFLLLPYASDWRWGLGESSPWYPSIRIIRQPTPGDWEGAVNILRQLLSDRRRDEIIRMLRDAASNTSRPVRA
jgi:hypothetical protein